VLTTMNSRYLVASFMKGVGRPSFRAFMQPATNGAPVSPIVQ
jgi:hypothetical protein